MKTGLKTFIRIKVIRIKQQYYGLKFLKAIKKLCQNISFIRLFTFSVY